MGGTLNGSGDLIPAEDLYKACRVFAKQVKYLGDLKWDFSAVHSGPIDPEFKRLVESYLHSVLSHPTEPKGWKLPETTLIFPWIVRLFPDIKYIFWVRDPRDGILKSHLTDDLADFGVPYDRAEDIRLQRAISWKYQSEIYKSTPKPKHLIEVRFEDFVLKQAETLKRLETFLGFSLATIEVRPESIGRWKRETDFQDFELWQEELETFGYLTPSKA